MPVYDLREKSFPVLSAIILSNLMPLIAVLFYDVSFFALFYLYWWETVIISVFQFIKMGKAQKLSEPDPNFSINDKTLTYEQVNSKRYMRTSYVVIRFLMLVFYLFFIVIFVGVLSTMKENPTAFVRALLFTEPWVKVSFAGFFVTHLVEYIFWRSNKEYEQTSLRELGTVFDTRVMVIHIVIVLGTFAAMFAGDKLIPGTQNAGSVAYVCLFVLMKIAMDVYAHNKSTRRLEVIGSLTNSLVTKKSQQK